jgi:hypothetical protein
MAFPRGTVFVLGAGASAPYGYPSGAELKNDIVAALLGQKPNGRREILPGPVLDAAVRAGAGSYGKIDEIARSIYASGVRSVDEWVNDHRGESQVVKAMLAQILLAAERISIQSPRQMPHARRDDEPSGDWLTYLLQAVLDAGPGGLADIAIVTFNFDRMVEQRVLTTLSGRYRVDFTRAAQMAGALKIVHVNGVLGMPPWLATEASKGVEFGKDEPPAVDVARDQIQFVYEEGAQDALRDATQLAADAPLVVFLGFGFHRMNTERIFAQAGDRRESVPWSFSADRGSGREFRPVRFFGSAYGMTRAEARQKESEFAGPIRLYETQDALMLLRSLPPLHGFEGRLREGEWEGDGFGERR